MENGGLRDRSVTGEGMLGLGRTWSGGADDSDSVTDQRREGVGNYINFIFIKMDFFSFFFPFFCEQIIQCSN